MDSARVAAAVTWVYAAGFGLPAVPVAIYRLQRGRLPTFFGLFPMYGGPWSSRVREEVFALLLVAYFLVTVAVGWSAWRLGMGLKSGALLNLVLLPVEIAFWLGFALPIPWVLGVARVGLIAAAWGSLR